MAMANDMRMEMDQIKAFMLRQEDEIARLKKLNRMEEEDNLSLEGESILGQRLYDIETELSEQKRSTAKITKLCMAAINSLERIEEKPVLIEMDDSLKEPDNPVDPAIIKTLCQQMEAINKLLIKVDDDIEAVDQKAEDGLSECEKIADKLGNLEKTQKDKSDSLMGEVRALLVSKTYATREDLTRSLKTIPLPISKEEIAKMIKDSYTDLSKTIKNSPTPLKKEEVAQMIDKATSNFLRTINAETSNCVEKVKDCEDYAKKEIEKLKKSIEENEKFFRKELWQVREQTDKNSKEVSRSLTEQQTKINVCNNNYDTLNKKLDSELKNAIESVKDGIKDDNKGVDESKFNLRMERLGKEMALVKAKQTEQTQQYDNYALRQTSMEQQTSNILKTVEKQQKEISKVVTCEGEIKKIGEKMEQNQTFLDQMKTEMPHKAFRNEVDEVKTSLDKDKSKITYFQDKINNISKSVDGVKIEVNNMRDKFCSDIENHTEMLKSVKEQEKKIAENSQALKGITTESMGKLKEMVNNCMQVETNIRSIRDKSILFDNDIKAIKDQLVHIKRDKSKSRPPSSDAEFVKQLRMKDDEIKGLSELVNGLKRKVQTTSSEINNLKEDNRTKELETEERQASLEQLLSDVRGWVESMLNESNKQLGDLAVEVGNANVKISKCTTDLGEVFAKHADNTGDMTFVKKNLEDKISEVKEFGSIQQRELLDKILDLRGSFVNNQTEFVEKLKLANESTSKMREEINNKVDKLESSLTRKIESKSTKTGAEPSDLSKRFDAMKKDVDELKSEANKVIVENKNKFKSISSDIAEVKATTEQNRSNYSKFSENVSKIEKEYLEKIKDGKKITDANKTELQLIKKSVDALGKESKQIIEEQNESLKKLVQTNEQKTDELTRTVQENQKSLELKLNDLEDSCQNAVNAELKNKNFASGDIDSKILSLKKDIDHVKNEIKNADLESFKNVVNSTTETHNKLINAVQKSVDLIICEKTILESQTAVMDSKITDLTTEKEIFENSQKEKISKFGLSLEDNLRQVNDLEKALRTVESKVDSMDKLTKTVEEVFSCVSEVKHDFNERLKENNKKICENRETLNSEVGSLKESMSSINKSSQEQNQREIKDITNSLQEKSVTNTNKINEAFEMLHSHTKILDNVNDSINQVNRNYEFSDSQIQKVELKLTSCIDELSKLDLFVTAAEMKKLERAVNDKSNKYSMSDVETKIETTKQDLESMIRTVNTKIANIDDSVKDFYSKLDNISDFNNFYNDVQALSSKVNQHKAKMIDLEANITMQDRITAKLSEDMKKCSLGMNKMGSPTGKTNSGDFVNSEAIDLATSKLKEEIHELQSKISTKVDFSDLNNIKSSIQNESEKMEKELKDLSNTLSTLKSSVDSKSNKWDKKIDSAEIDEIKKQLKEQINTLNVKLETLTQKNSEMSETFKSNSKKQDDELAEYSNKMSLQAIESKFFKKDEVRAIENSILGTISKLERNISNIEVSNKEISSKVADGDRKNSDNNEKFANLLSFKTKIDGKVSIWDRKVDTDQLKNIESNLKEELVKQRKDFSTELQNSMKEATNSSNNQKDEKKTSESMNILEKRIIAVESSGKDVSRQLTDFTKKLNNFDGDVKSATSSMNSLKSKVEEKADKKIIDSLENEMKNCKNDSTLIKTDLKALTDELNKTTGEMQSSQSNETFEKLETRMKEFTGNIENKLAIFENFRKTSETKFVEYQNIYKKNSDFESKINSKTNSEDFNKLDAFIRDEMKKTKKDVEYTLERLDNLQNQISSNQETNKQASSSLNEQKLKEIETKLHGTASKLEELKDLCSPLPSTIKNLSEAKEDSKNKLSLLESSLTNLKREGSNTLEKMEKLKMEVDSNISELRNAKNENKKSITEENLKSDIEKLENSSKESYNKVTEKTSSIEKSMHSITEELSKFKEKFGNVKWANENNLKDLDDFCKSQIKSLKSDVELTLNRIDDLKLQGDNALKGQQDSKTKEKVEETERKLTKDIQSCSKEISELSKKYDELSAIKSRLQTEKCDSSELNSLKNELSKKLENLGKNVENLKQETSDHKNEISSLNDITKKLSSLEVSKTDKSETMSQSLETRVTAGMAQLENKMAIFESSRKDINTKLTDLTSKQQKLNEECGGISEIKEKLKSKSETWDNKPDMKSIEQLLKTEIEKLKKDSKDETIKSDFESLKLDVTQYNSKQEEKFENVFSQCKILDSGLKEAQKTSGKLSEITQKITNMENQFNSDIKSMKGSFNTEHYAAKQDLHSLSEEFKTFKNSNTSNDILSKVDSIEKKYNETIEEINKMKSLTSEMKSSISKSFEDQITSEISKMNEKVASGVSNNKDRENIELSLRKLEDSLNAEKEKLGGMENKLNCIDVKDTLKKEDVLKLVQGYNFAKKEDLSDIIKRSDVSDFVRKSDVSDFAKKSEITDFAKKSEVGSDVKQLKTFINEELSKMKKSESSSDTSQNIDNLISKFISKEEFTVLDINYSKLSELVDHIQSEQVRQQQDSSSQADQIEKSISSLKTKLETNSSSSKTPETVLSSSGISDMMKSIQAAVVNLETNMQKIKSDVPSRGELERLQVAMENSHKAKDGLNITSIEKQKRGWEEAREKAEEMSQIFDSLIITNDRPYVSCGLDNEVTEPGFLEFSQFELINKVSFDTDSNQFTLIEPGVYLLQMGGTIENGNLIAKLVSDDIGVDFMTIEGSKNPCFKCRSSVFTIDDDDQIAESLMVELVGNNDGQCCVGTDFFFMLYKISEVANVDSADQM